MYSVGAIFESRLIILKILIQTIILRRESEFPPISLNVSLILKFTIDKPQQKPIPIKSTTFSRMEILTVLHPQAKAWECRNGTFDKNETSVYNTTAKWQRFLVGLDHTNIHWHSSVFSAARGFFGG